MLPNASTPVSIYICSVNNLLKNLQIVNKLCCIHTFKLLHNYFIFSISFFSQLVSLAVQILSVMSIILCPTIYLMAYSSTLYSFAFVTKCFRPSCGLWFIFSPSSFFNLSNTLLYRLYVSSISLLRLSGFPLLPLHSA